MKHQSLAPLTVTSILAFCTCLACSFQTEGSATPIPAPPADASTDAKRDVERDTALDGCRPQEICNNGKDDNCNQQVDEGCGCTPGAEQACYDGAPELAGVGRCRNGRQECESDSTWGPCIGAVYPSEETCNNEDDNCDGAIDSFAASCDSTCGAATRTCANGQWSACVPTSPPPEICDTIDNDCDGQVDENLVEACGECNRGERRCEKGTWTSCELPADPQQLQWAGTIRDFREAHPDFEDGLGGETGIVTTDLGADGKPVYAHGNSPTATVTNQASFDQWFRDTANVNQSAPYAITLKRGGEDYSYHSSSFFPIDNQLFGNENRSHNFHFTYELHGRFQYIGGESFKFSGDDDFWLFINRKLVIDLGGVHTEQTKTVSLDALTWTGIARCEVVDIDLFFAERHTTGSNFKVDTSLRWEPR